MILSSNETVSIESDDKRARKDIAEYLLNVFSKFTLDTLKTNEFTICKIGDVDYHCYQKTIH